jgi:hypothetical protein
LRRHPARRQTASDSGTARRRLARASGAPALGALVLPLISLGASAGAATSSSLSQYLLRSNEMPGYTVGGHPSTMTTAAGLLEGGSLTRKQRNADISTLEKAGFVKAVEESAKGANANEGLSIVLQFDNPAGAQTGAALFLQMAKTGQSGTKPFMVAGVPSGKGVTVNGSAGGSANAYWFAGNCAFGSGIYDSTATSAKAVAGPVQTGIRSQAKRVGTTCP